MIYGVTTAKVPCRFCGLHFYPGNMDRHVRKCLRTPDEQRRMQMLRRLARRGVSA